MAGRIGTWRTSGPAEPAKVRAAMRVDAAIALALGMLLWPFPVMRANVPWAVHVPLILAFVWLIEWAVPVAEALLWGRTLGMYLFDLGLEGRPYGLGRVLRWGLGAAVVAFPLLTLGGTDPAEGIPARLSGLRTASARGDEPGAS